MKINTIEIDSIQKKYDLKTILSDVYIKFSTNEIVGLLGRNGSGKSTLLKIIFGIENSDFKFIRINGVTKSKVSDLLKDISYLDQDHFIPKQFTVKKAISLTIQKKSILDFYNDEMIQQIKNSNVKDLSGGELRYLELKLILSNNSKFAFLDEPYNGLSPIMITKVNEMIKQYSNTKGILITDHNYNEIIKLSTKIILMKEGKTIAITNSNQLYDYGYLI